MTKIQKRMTRVNARLGKDDARRFAELVRRERKPVSDILRLAIRRFYDEMRAPEGSVLDAFERAAFVGCGESSVEAATDFNREFADYLERKHGHR
jgi:hypothetical protein